MQIISNLSAIYSIVSFYAFSNIDLENLSLFQGIALGAAVVATLLFLIQASILYRSRARSYDDAEYKEFMAKWIKDGKGRTVIVSDLLSWGNIPKIRRVLEEKAKQGNLQLIMRQETATSAELEKLGAQIYYYLDESMIPETRFTMNSEDRGYSRVAVGWPTNKSQSKHIVHVYQAGTDPFVSTAKDLVRSLRKEALSH